MAMDEQVARVPTFWSSALVWLACAGVACAVGTVLHSRIVQDVSYKLRLIDVPSEWLSYIGLAVFLCCAGLLLVSRRRGHLLTRVAGSGLSIEAERSMVRAVAPLMLPALIGLAWLLGREPGFVDMCCAFLGFGWSIDRMGQPAGQAEGLAAVERLAPVLLVLAIAAATVWHFLQQVLFWKHFLLGYADFGLFTTELEHCLPWKNVGDLRFATTRMGFHCVPMFYLLVPFYMVWRSPLFLMVVGPLALNISSIAFYQLAQWRTGSRTIGLLVALGWLLLPSVTRLPYSNTYGFQSIYLAVPWLAFCFSYRMRGRWRASHLCLVGAILCEETVCGVAFGWGVYLWLFGGRRKDGAVVMIASVAYLVLCTTIIIPHFDVAGEYTRLKLFGGVGPWVLLNRLARDRVLFFLLALTVPLMPGIWRCRRLLIAAVPTFLLIAMLQQYDYLNIKYWHQSSILPLLFTACVVGITDKTKSDDSHAATSMRALGPALGLLVTILLFHQWMGSSPIAQSQRVYADDARLNQPDPRMAAVEFVRDRFNAARTSVVATERMAAHFIDYRMVFPVAEIQLHDTTDRPCVLVVDREDRWDKIIMLRQNDVLFTQAKEAGYQLVGELDSVVVLANAPALKQFRGNTPR